MTVKAMNLLSLFTVSKTAAKSKSESHVSRADMVTVSYADSLYF